MRTRSLRSLGVHEMSTIRRPVTRRTALRYFAVGAGGLIAAACAPAAAPSPSPAAATAAASRAANAAPRWGMTAAEETAWKEIEAAAAKEAKVTYYALGNLPASRVNDLKAAWNKDYPGIEFQYVPLDNNANVIARITTEQESKTYVADVAEMSLANGIRLDPKMFEALALPAAKDPAAKWAFDPIATVQSKQVHTSIGAQYYGFWYNTKLVKREDAPKTYMDLTNPKWKGQLIWRTPFVTGGGNHTYVFATKVYGADWATKMQAQKPTLADNQDAALMQVARGEYPLAFGITGRQAPDLIKQGLPIAIVWPDDIGIRTSNGLVVANQAPHRNAGKVFLNWALTPAGQALWRDVGQFPILTSVPPAEEWMKDFTRSKQQFENLASPADLQKSLDEAAKLYKT